MKITNKYNLPQAIVEAVKNDGYSKGDADISVTELIKPPQMRQLEKKHWDELEEDVSDRIFSLYGQIVHLILERAGKTVKNEITERRLSIDVNGWKVSGSMDNFILDTGTLVDYKFTQVAKVGRGVSEEWAIQTNIYAHILRAHGTNVKRLQIVPLLRDWYKAVALRSEEGYPPHPIFVMDVPLVEAEEVKKYIEDRVALHQKAEQGEYTECTQEERWATPDQWAVMKPGGKRAHRLLLTEASAQLVANEVKGNIVFRPGESKRCEYYCLVKDFCKQYKDTKK